MTGKEGNGMKKKLALLLALAVVFPSTVYSADMGIQLIQIEGDASEDAEEPVSMDDIKLNAHIDLPGYARFTATAFEIVDAYGYYRSGRNDVYDYNNDYMHSGSQQEYAILSADLLNTARVSKDFLENCEVTFTYDEKYVFTGYARQRNYNNTTYNGAYLEKDINAQNTNWAIHTDNIFPIDQLYEGHYFFVGELPNTVAYGKASLSMTVRLDGNEITYIIRDASSDTALEDAMKTVAGDKPAENTIPDLDDMKLKTPTELSDFAMISYQACKIKDSLGYYRSGRTDVYDRNDYFQSGNEADYALVFANIVNLQNEPVDFLADCEVKVVYDDTYEFLGWSYQRNYDNSVYGDGPVKEDHDAQNTNWAINADDQFLIDPLYTGHYIFGCTLPNAAVQGKESLQMIVRIKGTEIVYNIR